MNKRRGQALCQFNLTKESFTERAESVFSDESFWSMARSVLDERQYNICKRYLSENITYKELGAEYGISPERVRQLLFKGMRKIRRAINTIPCSNISEFNGIENLCLNIRIYNCLKRSGYNTIQDVKDRLIGNEDEIMRVRNLGKKSYVKIVEAIKWFDKESGVK